MKRLYTYILVTVFAFSAVSCFKKDRPNYQYFSNVDMYYSPSYETYGEYPIFQDGQSALTPVEGTIPRGWEVFDYPNTFDGRKAAQSELKNPLPYTERNVTHGGQVYDIYCAICHGYKGDGEGPLVQREKFMGVPGFVDPNRDFSDGNIYHVVYYGLNNMGSYAAQTTNKERWQIIHYINSLIDELEGREKRPFEKDTTLNRDHFDKEISPELISKK